MRKALQLFLFGLLTTTLPYAMQAQTNLAQLIDIAERQGDKSGYAVDKYVLNMSPNIDKPYLKANVAATIIALQDDLQDLKMDLANAYKIAKIDGALSFVQKGDVVTIKLPKPLKAGDRATLDIYYEGQPPLVTSGRITKGLRWETHGENKERIIANLSTPFLAYLWFPCKDGPNGKTLSGVQVNITVPNIQVGGIPLVGVSNGVLKNVVKKDDNITYEWVHNYPIVPYYVMMAVSNYRKLEQKYKDPLGNEFPLEYYVFDEHVKDAREGTKDMPKVMDFYTEVFGEYPYAKEKYGMTQLGFYSGIENQTNSIVNNMSPAKFYTSIHELAHMWFADAITCVTWEHGWLNEGFASYAEALYDERAIGKEKYIKAMLESTHFEEESMFLPKTTDPFKVFVGSIYNKGQWTVHMLRGVVGDDVFFKSLKEYASNPNFRGGFASTEDLKAIFEKNSRRNLSFFFDEWVYGSSFPTYTTTAFQDKRTKKISFSLVQEKHSTKPEFFSMPVEVQLNYTDGSSEIKRVENNTEKQNFDFDSAKKLKDVSFDPNNWVLKKVKSENLILSNKSSFQVSIDQTSNDALKVTSLSSKSQKVEVEIFNMAKQSVFKNKIKIAEASFIQDIKFDKPLDNGNYTIIYKTKDMIIKQTFSILKKQ